LAHDAEFQAYLGDGDSRPVTAADADQFIKMRCGIESKSELDQPRDYIRSRFEAIEGNFRAWKQAKGHGQLER
jgi:hypothetical protein